MRSFKQILWWHLSRQGIPVVVLFVTGTLLIDWHFENVFPSQQRIVLYCVWYLIVVGILTVWNAWIEWRRARRASVE